MCSSIVVVHRDDATGYSTTRISQSQTDKTIVIIYNFSKKWKIKGFDSESNIKRRLEKLLGGLPTSG